MAFHFEETSWEVFYLEEEERMKKKFWVCIFSLSLVFSHGKSRKTCNGSGSTYPKR